MTKILTVLLLKTHKDPTASTILLLYDYSINISRCIVDLDIIIFRPVVRRAMAV